MNIIKPVFYATPVSEFQPNRTEFACGPFAVATLAWGISPINPGPYDVSALSSWAYTEYTKVNGDAGPGNTNGSSIGDMEIFLRDTGSFAQSGQPHVLHYWEFSPSVNAIIAVLTAGYPVIITVTEDSVFNIDGTSPYWWGPSGNHIFVIVGIDTSGNFLVYDSAAVEKGDGNLQTVKVPLPWPRTYQASKLNFPGYAAIVKMPWNPAIPSGNPLSWVVQQLTGVDYSSSMPDIATMLNYGVRFACRYVGYSQLSQSKILTLAEAQKLSAAGISIVSNYEWYAGRPLEGYNSGVWDAHTALQYHAAAGGPPDAPIYFSVDLSTPTDMTAIYQYFQGIASVLPISRIGAYGSYDTVRLLKGGGYITYCWQTYAWSNGQWYTGNNIEQYSNGVILPDGSVVDLDRSMTNYYGQWIIGSTPGTTGVNYMESQFNDVWYSNGVQAGYQSGIYKVMLQGFLSFKYSACFPTSGEIKTTTWSGSSILYQTMSNGHHCEYANGQGKVYDPSGKLVWVSTI